MPQWRGRAKKNKVSRRRMPHGENAQFIGEQCWVDGEPGYTISGYENCCEVRVTSSSGQERYLSYDRVEIIREIYPEEE